MMDRKYYPLIILLAALTLLLSAFAAFGPLAEFRAESAVEDGWITYIDPVYNFAVQRPADWDLQPLPYYDFGWRLSSPDAKVDVMGRLSQGAYLRAGVSPVAEFDINSFQKPYYHIETNEVTQLENPDGLTYKIIGKTAYSSEYIDFLHYIDGNLYHFSFQCHTSTCGLFEADGIKMLESILILGPPTNDLQPALEKHFEAFDFPSLKHGIPAGEGRFMGDYSGPYHTGGDDYAVDVIECDGAASPSCWQGVAGQIVLAQTDMKYVYSADANNDPDDAHDFHFFDLGLDGDTRLCMSYGHIYIYGVEIGDTVQQGAVVGVLSYYLYAAPHIHMGIYTVPGSPSDPQMRCAQFGRTALPYTGQFALDGVEYPIGLDFQGDMTTSTNQGFCPGDPNNPPADLSECIDGPAAPTALTPTGNIFTRQPTFTWSKVNGAVQYRLITELLSDPANDVIDIWLDAGAVCATDTCTYTTTTTLDYESYIWAVRGKNLSTEGESSNILEFRVHSDQVPPRPVITSPSGQIYDVTPTYIFDDQPEAEDFRLYISHASVGTVIHEWYLADDVCTGGTCQITHDTHLQTGNHAWWVQSRNPNGGSDPWSIPLNFKLFNVTPPDAQAQNMVPTGTIATNQPTFSWDAVERASWYKVFVGSQTTGKVYNEYHRAYEICSGTTCSITPTEYTISGSPSPTLDPGDHTWYVMPVNVAGNGSWSAAQAFTVGGP